MNFTICGEAVQDFGELIKLQLTSGSVQFFDTKAGSQFIGKAGQDAA